MVSKQIKSWRQLYLNLNMYAQVNEASWALIREAQCPLRLGICVQLGRGVWLAMRVCYDHWWYAARIDVAVCLLALFHPLLLLTLLACPGYVCRARWLTVLCQFVIAPYSLTCPFASSTTVALLKAFFALKIQWVVAENIHWLIDWLTPVPDKGRNESNFKVLAISAACWLIEILLQHQVLNVRRMLEEEGAR